MGQGHGLLLRRSLTLLYETMVEDCYASFKVTQIWRSSFNFNRLLFFYFFYVPLTERSVLRRLYVSTFQVFYYFEFDLRSGTGSYILIPLRRENIRFPNPLALMEYTA